MIHLNLLNIRSEIWRRILIVLLSVIPWNVHETYQGNYINFDKLVKFIKLAQTHDLLVLVRPGPYICAEWEFGGFPYWLLKNKTIKLRTSDNIFMSYVEKWMSVLLPALAPLLYSNGGPIIMVQVRVLNFLRKKIYNWNRALYSILTH